MVRALIATLLIASAAPAFADPAAVTVAERMLAALGGREAWARAKNTVNDSRQDWDGDPSVLQVVITMDFERPRIRIETRGEGLHLIRVLDGEKHWRRSRDGSIGPVSEPTLAAQKLAAVPEPELEPPVERTGRPKVSGRGSGRGS